MPDVRRREFILLPTGSRPPGRARRARQSPRGYRGAAAATHLGRLTAALAATILVGSRGPYPPMLVGVSGSDVHDHQIRQIDHATALGRLRLSPSAAPMPAGILGGLWRVPLLEVGFTAAMAASGAAWTGAHAGLGR